MTLKAMLGMYFYSYLWLRPTGTLAPQAVADKLGELALAMLAAPPAAVGRRGGA